jgi:hypothetical protein
MRLPVFTVLAALAVFAFSLGEPLPARADISVAGGGYISSIPTATGGALMVSSGASIPAFPVELQGTVFVPLAKQGGYVVLGEVRGFTGGGFGGAYIGAGAGIGNLAGSRVPGPALSLFAGKSIAPFTSIEIRIIQQTQITGTTAGFLGLRFTF